MIQRILAVGILLAGLLPSLTGMEPAPTATAPTTTITVEEAVTTNTPPAAVNTAEPNIIEYNNIDLQTALRTLATKAGMSLILGDNVTGNVTVHLEDIAYTNAMKLIAESKGYAYIEDRHYKNLVKIQSKTALEAEPVAIQVTALRYAKADDLKTVLTPMLTAQGKILVDSRVNTLIISDVPSNLLNLQSIVETLDSQTTQVGIEAKFVEHTQNPRKDLGVNWSQSLLNHTVGLRRSNPATPIQSNTTDPTTGAITVNNPSPLEFAKNLGGGPWTMPTAIFDAGEAQVAFSFLSQDADTELLANPRVVTTDNGTARIAISEEWPIPQFQYNSTIGALQISGFNYKDIGIVLNVIARINNDDFITLEVAPEVSTPNGFATLGTGSQTVQIPVIDTRNVKATVLIKSGHTLCIGGMTRTDVTDSYTKVPLVGDIPGLGVIFRSKSLNKLKRELYIFLTPTIIRAADQLLASRAVTDPPVKRIFANDTWMPHDSAKPAAPSAPKRKDYTIMTGVASTNAPAQNFKSQSP